MQRHEFSRLKRSRPAVTDLAERLRRSCSKLTGPRRAVLEVLLRQAHPVSTKEIFAALPARRSDLATVYRSLRLLETLGLIKRFDLGDGVGRFELLGEEDDGHHHHLVCTRCSGVVEIDDCFPRELEEAVASKHQFTSVTHKLEFFGICPKCHHR